MRQRFWARERCPSWPARGRDIHTSSCRRATFACIGLEKISRSKAICATLIAINNAAFFGEVILFTGIVEEVGKVTRITQRGENRRITVEAKNTPRELGTGQSVSVSGVCLTALDIKPNSFCADLAPETWTRTSLSRIHEGALVNLELPMKADGRFGGHIVQGHVDGVGKLIAFERILDSEGRESENWWLHIEIPSDVEKYTVFKGSISIEGISLTVAKLEKNRCTIAIIPHTVELTNLGSLKPGDPVNLEADVIAKYVEKMMKGEPSQNSLTVEELVQQGF